MNNDKISKFAIAIVVFFVLLIVQNLAYADIFIPYYKLLPSVIEAQLPGIVIVFLFFINLITNFVILMVLTKIIYEYENLVRVLLGTFATTFFQMLINLSIITSSIDFLGTIDKTTVIGCFLEGSGVFILSLFPLFILNYLIIRFVFNMKETRVFYGFSMAILLNPMYHYILFYTPLLKVLGIAPYVFI